MIKWNGVRHSQHHPVRNESQRKHVVVHTCTTNRYFTKDFTVALVTIGRVVSQWYWMLTYTQLYVCVSNTIDFYKTNKLLLPMWNQTSCTIHSDRIPTLHNVKGFHLSCLIAQTATTINMYTL